MVKKCLERITMVSIIFSCLVGLRVTGQEKLSLSTFGSTEGLSQNSVYSILKDRSGLMWFATQDGLNQYDGQKIKVYRHRFQDARSLPSNFITTLTEDGSGNIWIGTRLGGLSRFNRLQDNFSNFKHTASNPSSLSNDKINVVYKDNALNIWVGTAGGLNLFNKSKGSFKRYLSKPGSTNTLSSNVILSIYEDKKNNLWIGTDSGLNLLDRRTGECIRFIDQSANQYTDNAINAINEDEQGRIWLGTNKGLKVLDITSATFRHFNIRPDAHSLMAVNPVFCIIKAGQHKFWLGTNTTLQCFQTQKEQLISVSNEIPEDNLLPNDGIYSLFTDSTGILWIGTTSQGILKHDSNLTTFPAFKSSLKSVPSAEHIIRGISEDNHRNLYLATDAGLLYMNRKTNSYKLWQYKKNDRSSLSSNYTTGVLASKINHKVWIGTFNSGLNSFNPATKSFTRFTKGTRPDQLSSDAIYTLFEDRKGNIWIGTENGLNRYNPATKRFTKYFHQAGNPHSIADNAIQAIGEDARGQIWIGGYNNGISVFNPLKETFFHLNKRNSALRDNVISSLHAGQNGNMWIGTMEGGLNFYDHSSGKITAFTEDEGLVNNTINYISEDASGQLWLSTNQGIVRFDPRKRVYKNFNLHNGLQTMEFNVNSGARLASGELVFGSINGFNLVNPKAVRFNRNKPRVLITALELFNRPVHARAKNSPLKQIISTTDTLKLTYNQSIFTLRFAALDYTMPSNNRYAYKLEGFDEQWRLANDQPEATYTKLDPGSYVFKVKGSNNDGVWNPTPAELTIVIEPPYWMTWWFRILIVCLAGGLLMIAYNYRMQYFKKQRFQLQTLVKQRTARIIAQTKEVQHLNNELETNSRALQLQSEELKSKAETLERVNAELIQQKAEEKKARHEADLANRAKSTFLATMSHEIRTPMNGVLGMASLLRETEMTAEQREYTDAILNSGDSLLNVINDILDFTKIESGHMELDHHAFNLNKCVADALEMFSSKKANPKVQLHYHIDPAVPKEILTDSHRLKQVLTNLVGNAVKFTREGEILVSITGDKNPDQTWSLSFSVKDTGIGIPQDKIAELFTPFRQIDSSMSRKYGGSGLGLVISQRLVALLGGSMKVESELGRGSVFSFGIRCSSLQEQNSKIAPDLAPATDVQEKNVLSAVLARDFPFKILVAEDNLMNQRLILRILGKLGYHPDIANDGLEALEMLKKQYYELILMDVQMPNLDGLETTRRIRQTYGGKPLIIAMTANVLNEDKQNCFQAGVNSYIAKPLDLDLFVSTLKNLHKLR